MIIIDVSKNDAVVTQSEKLTSGTVGLKCQFNFSEEWNELDKIAVCVCGSVVKDAIVDETNTIKIPWEVLAKHGKYLDIGVYGTDGNGKNVIPTVYATVGAVCKGADPSGDESIEPSPSIWEQVLSFIKNVPYTIDAMGKAIFHGHAESASADERGNLIHSHYASAGYVNSTFCNAPMGKADGVGVVRMDDLSPVNPNIVVSPDVQTGFKSYGKNLFLTANPRRATNTVTVTDNVIEWYGDYYFIVPVQIPKGVPFTWSYSKFENEGTSAFLRVVKRYTDGTGDSGTSQDKTQIPEKDMSELWVYKSVAAEINTSIITDFQIEIGSSATEYELGKQPVNGIEVTIPTTTLVADTSGVKITAEYNKDINKVIEELKNAILNLGGTI